MSGEILIIANPYDAEVLRRAVTAGGYEASVADGGGAVHELFAERRPLAVVLAQRLARADSDAVLGELRALDRDGKRLPVVLVGETGEQVVTLRDAIERGADQLVLRPVDPSLLLAKIEALLEERDQLDAGGGWPAVEEALAAHDTADAAGFEDTPTSLEACNTGPVQLPESSEDGDGGGDGEQLAPAEGLAEDAAPPRIQPLVGTAEPVGEALLAQLQQEAAAVDRELFAGGDEPFELLAPEGVARARGAGGGSGAPAPAGGAERPSSSTASPEARPAESEAGEEAGEEAAAEEARTGADEPLLPQGGQLASVDLPQLLVLIHRAGFTGRLSLERDDAEKAVFFDGGYPVFAVSNQPHDRLGDLLYREGKITREQLERCQEHLGGSGRRMGAVLVDLGLIKPQELFPLVRRHVEEVLYSLFAWAEGTFVLHPSSSVPEEKIRLDVHPHALVVEGIRRKYGLDRLLELVGTAEAVVVVHNRGARRLERAALEADERRAVELMDGTRPLARVIELGPLDELAAYQLSYALLVLGAGCRRSGDEARVSEFAAPAVAQQRDVTIDRQRLLAKYAQVCESDYFSLLGLRLDATTHEVRRAYQRMRREFDPSHFSASMMREHGEQLAEVLEVLEEAFLVLSDERLREAYRQHVEPERA